MRFRTVAGIGVTLGVVVLAAVHLGRRNGGGAAGPGPGDVPSALQSRVRVEVLNGGGRRGAAKEATEILRERGFDVVYFGNAADFGRDSSVVLDRVGRPEGARDVAEALGIPNVRSEPDPNLYLDVSVMLGREWRPAEVGTPDPTGQGGSR